MSDSPSDIAADADVQRVRDYWVGRVSGLQAAEKRVKKIIRNYQGGLKADGLNKADPLYVAVECSIWTLKKLIKDLHVMQHPPKD
jgi:hypothetical protein